MKKLNRKMSTKILKYIINLLVLNIAVTNIIAQLPQIGSATLHAKIDSKTNFFDVMKEVELFYKSDNAKVNIGTTPIGEFDNDYAKWKRWEYATKPYINQDGKMGNIQNVLWSEFEKANTQIETFGSGLREPSSPTTPDWTFSGPFSSSYNVSPPSGLNGLGRCDRIAFHPTDPNIIFIGTPNGGLWKTINGGTSWNCLTSFLPIAGVSGVVVDWSNPNNILILTGSGDDQFVTAGTPGIFSSIGVFRSTDGGINWHKTTTPWPSTIGPAPFQLKQSPRFANKILMATSYGLFSSSNYGETWVTVLQNSCYDVDFVPGTDTVWVALGGTLNPIKRSSFGGAIGTFANVSFGAAVLTPIPLAANRISLAVTNVNLATSTELVYIFAGPVTGNGTFNGLYKTNSSGFISLQRNTPNLFDNSLGGNFNFNQSTYDNCIAVNPDLPNTILTGGAKIFKSIDGGGTIINGAGYSEAEVGFDLTKYVHGDIHDLAYNPLNNYLYAAGDGGISYSADNGLTWANISTGLTTSMFYDIAGVESNQYAILGGLQDNGNKYRNTNSSNFIHIGAFDGFHGAISPSNPTRGYYSANQFFIRSGVLGASTGAVGINPVTAANQWAWKMNTDLLDGDFLYGSPLGTDSTFISFNAGTNWSEKHLGGGQNEIVHCPSDANRMYIMGGISLATNALRRSDNQGFTWTTNLLTNPGIPSTVAQIPNDVQVSPINSNLVFTCFAGFEAGNKVFLSGNAGANWVNISYNLPNIPILCLAIDNSDNVYAGTDFGVYVKLNGANVWYLFSNKLPRTRVNDLMINRANGILYAATYGRGVWHTNVVNTPCSDAFYYVNGNVTGERFYEAGVIWSVANMDTMQGTKVTFKATDSIKLFNNFRASEGVEEFRAYIGPCGSNYPVLSKVNNTTTIDIKKIVLPTNEQDGNYPFGTIRIAAKDNILNIILDAKKEGDFKIRLSNENGEFIKTLYELPKAAINKHQLTIPLSNMPKNFYYVHLLYNDTLVHYQQLDLTSTTLDNLSR
jgi:hypothetical protein